jgi:flagellar basal body-associated protein FliL
LIRGIPVKTTKILFIVAFMFSLCVFSGLVAAFDQNSLSATPVFSKEAPNIGGQITIRITVQNNAGEELQIVRAGINFDWMDSNTFAGVDLGTTPQVVAAGSSYTTPPFIIQVPTNVTVGSHSYFLGVDGTESPTQTDFSWNSSSTTIIIVPANATGTTTVPTTIPTEGGSGTASTSPLTLIIYIAVIAIVAVIVVVLIVMFMEKRRKPKPSTEPKATPATPAAEQPKKPEEENYSI